MKSVLAAAALAAAVTSVHAKTVTDITVKPGPPLMSSEEKAIAADPAKGVQHGVILLEETEQNDNQGTISEVAYHMRAKILSLEGRALADIAIPVQRKSRDLKTWWGRTIFPDGHVQELSQSELTAQAIAKWSSGDVTELRGALPGVVPGCVIDYGYVVEHERFNTYTRVFLQREWPVRAMRYRWVPSQYFPAAYTMSRAEGLPVTAKYDSQSVLVTANGLDPVPEEPHMPPLDEARASVILYYTNNEKAAEFWNLEAKRVEQALKSFVSGGAMKETIAALQVPPNATQGDRLRAAYDWIARNVKNTSLMSAEEEEADEQDDKNLYNAKSVLSAKQGSPRQLDYLFAGLARALGAEANVVFAVDRTDRYWNKSFKSMDQFSYTFVAVRAPGEPDEKLVLVDAGSGLPYGQVPWRATGGTALMCGAKGSSEVTIPSASPLTNRADTHVTLAFSEDNETMTAQWARTSNGATGVEYRRWLRNLDARERKTTLDRLCGAAGMTEVTAAELPGLEEPAAPFQIACDIEQSEMAVHDGLARYLLHVAGPWWPETPEFTAATRVHPVVFDFPKLDIVGIDITAPHGFKPMAPPAPIQIESPFGRYQLSVAPTDEGFHVDRAFALTVLTALPKDYDHLRKFFADIRAADRATVAFEPKGGAK